MLEDEVKEQTENSAEDETSSESGALIELNTADLNKESLALINQIIAETDVEKTKDLTYLFNINQNKKTMVRMDKLNGLQDDLVSQLAKRIHERPDEISNQDLMNALKLTQDIIERGQKQIAGINETPLIQINQQTNTVNVGDNLQGLNRDSRERVKNAVMSLLSSITQEQPKEVVDVISQETLEEEQQAEAVVLEDTEDDD